MILNNSGWKNIEKLISEMKNQSSTYIKKGHRWHLGIFRGLNPPNCWCLTDDPIRIELARNLHLPSSIFYLPTVSGYTKQCSAVFKSGFPFRKARIWTLDRWNHDLSPFAVPHWHHCPAGERSSDQMLNLNIHT